MALRLINELFLLTMIQTAYDIYFFQIQIRSFCYSQRLHHPSKAPTWSPKNNRNKRPKQQIIQIRPAIHNKIGVLGKFNITKIEQH